MVSSIIDSITPPYYYSIYFLFLTEIIEIKQEKVDVLAATSNLTSKDLDEIVVVSSEDEDDSE